MKRHRRFRRGGLALFLLSSICAALFAVYYFRSQLSPLIEEMAVSIISTHALAAINSAIDEEILAGDLDYDDMILFEKNGDGSISALKTNMSTVNRLKTELLDKIITRTGDDTSTELYIPLGNIFGSRLLSGRGPRIPVKIVSVSSPSASFESRFSAAGINQTRHQIIMNIEMYITVLVPGASTGTNVSADICVAETVLLGAVPESYAYFENTDSAEDALDDYLNIN